MRRLAPLLILLGLTITHIKAQTTTPTEAGRLLNQFIDALDGNTTIDQWQLHKKTFKSTAAKISTGVALAKNTLAVYQYIKPEKFVSGFNRTKFEQSAKNAKTYTDASKVLQSLEEGLKRDAFDRYVPWANQRKGWLAALQNLK